MVTERRQTFRSIMNPMNNPGCPGPAEKHCKSEKLGSNISVKGVGNQMSPALIGTDKSLDKLAVEYGHQIPSLNS